MIEQYTTSACETLYRVTVPNGAMIVRLWAIVGGTLAMSTQDFYFQERFNYCPERDSKINPNWAKWGGVPVELLVNGALTVYDYVQHNLPRYTLQKAREQQLPRSIRSKRFHWREDMSYFRVTWGYSSRVSGLSIHSIDDDRYSMPVGYEHAPYTNEAIEAAQAYIKSIKADYPQYLCDLTNSQFEGYVKAIYSLKEE